MKPCVICGGWENTDFDDVFTENTKECSCLLSVARSHYPVPSDYEGDIPLDLMTILDKNYEAAGFSKGETITIDSANEVLEFILK